MAQVNPVEFATAPAIRAELPESHVQVNTVVDASNDVQSNEANQLADLFKVGGADYQKQLDQSKEIELQTSVSNARLDAGLQMQTVMQQAKTQDPDSQLGYFKENYQKYVDQKLDGVDDEKTRGALMITYNQFALAGQQDVFESANKVRNGLALSAFDTNAENFAKLAADAPNTAMRELYNSKVKEGFDDLVSSGALPADKAVDGYTKYRESVAQSIVSTAINQGKTGYASAMMKQLDPDLSLEKRTVLRNQLSNEQDRQAQAAQTQALKAEMAKLSFANESAERPGDAAVKYLGADPANPNSMYDLSNGRAVMPESIAKGVAANINTITDPRQVTAEVTALQQKYKGPQFDIAMDQLQKNGLESRILGVANYHANNPDNGAAQQIDSMMYYTHNAKAVDEQFKGDKSKSDETFYNLARGTMSDYMSASVDSGKTDRAINNDITNVVSAAKGYLARNPNSSASDAITWAAKPYAIDPFNTRVLGRGTTIQIPKVLPGGNGYALDADAIEHGLDTYPINPKSVVVPNTQFTESTANNLTFVEANGGVRLVYKSPNGSTTQAYDATTKKPIKFDWIEAQKLGWDAAQNPGTKTNFGGIAKYSFEHPLIDDRGL